MARLPTNRAQGMAPGSSQLHLFPQVVSLLASNYVLNMVASIEYIEGVIDTYRRAARANEETPGAKGT